MSRIGEFMATNQVGRVAEQPRTHGIALPCNAIGTGAGTSDIPSHEGEIDDSLGGARGFMALVYSHGPPERNCLAALNRGHKLFKSCVAQTRGFACNIGCELFNEICEFIKTGGVCV